MWPLNLIEHPERYRIDRRELGKVLLVASTALLVVSVHATLSFQDSLKDVKKVDQNLDQAEAIMDSRGFNQSLQAINSLETVDQVDIYNQFKQASNAFKQARAAIQSAETARDNLESNYEMYRWLVLISILGQVAGLAVMYI